MHRRTSLCLSLLALTAGCGTAQTAARPPAAPTPATHAARAAITSAPSPASSASVASTSRSRSGQGAGTADGSAAKASGASSRPAVLVGWTTDHRLVRLDPHTGKITRTLYVATSTPWPGLALTPDRSTVYFATAAGIMRMPVDGNTAPQLSTPDAYDPRISPDGHMLAWHHMHAEAVGTTYLPDGHSGQPAMYVPDQQAGKIDLELGGWGPDSRGLTIEVDGAGHGEHDLAVISGVGHSVVATEPTGLEFRGQPTTLQIGAPTWLPDGTLLAAVIGHASASGAPGPNQVVTLDATTGHIERVLATTGTPATAMAADRTGQHLLFVTSTAHGPELYASDNGASPTLLTPGISVAAW